MKIYNQIVRGPGAGKPINEDDGNWCVLQEAPGGEWWVRVTNYEIPDEAGAYAHAARISKVRPLATITVVRWDAEEQTFVPSNHIWVGGEKLWLEGVDDSDDEYTNDDLP